MNIINSNDYGSFIYFIYLIYFIYFIYFLYFVYLHSLLQLYFNNYKILCNMKLDLLIILYFYALINLCLGCLANCVVTNALHALCTSMYHYDCFYICKDLTEGEINQSVNQTEAGSAMNRPVAAELSTCQKSNM